MNSLRTGLLLRVGAVVAAVLIAGGFALDGRIRSELQVEFDRSLAARLLPLADLMNEPYEDAEHAAELAGGFESPELDEELEATFAAEFGPGSTSAYQVWWRDRGTESRSPSLGEAGFTPLTGLSPTPQFHDLATPDGRRWRAAAIVLRSPVAGAVDVLIADQSAPFERQLAASRRALLAVGSGVLITTLALLFVALRRAVEPLDRFAARLAEVAAPDFGAPLPEPAAPTEVALFARRFNELRARLQDAFARERRFCDAVAHELRTPVAELRASAEVALAEPADVAGLELAARDAHAIALHMGALVTSLLALHRGEPGSAGSLVVVPLGALVRELLERAAPAAQARQLSIEVELPDDAAVVADRDLARAIVQNLVTNAIDHARPGSRVRLRFTRDERGFVLQLRNPPAAALCDADVARFAEPFWRHDTARGGGHIGLGWSVARSMALSLGTTLRARLEQGDVVVEWAGP